MFENYTSSSRETIFLACCEAGQLGATVIEPEHILLSLLREKAGYSSFLTKGSFPSLEQLRKEIESSSGGRTPTPANTGSPFSSVSKVVLRKAKEESILLEHEWVATIHILLALASLESATTYQILNENGLTTEHLRNQIKSLNFSDLLEVEIDGDICVDCNRIALCESETGLCPRCTYFCDEELIDDLPTQTADELEMALYLSGNTTDYEKTVIISDEDISIETDKNTQQPCLNSTGPLAIEENQIKALNNYFITISSQEQFFNYQQTIWSINNIYPKSNKSTLMKAVDKLGHLISFLVNKYRNPTNNK